MLQCKHAMLTACMRQMCHERTTLSLGMAASRCNRAPQSSHAVNARKQERLLSQALHGDACLGAEC